MSKIVEVLIPKYPECWSSCGNCGSGILSVTALLLGATVIGRLRERLSTRADAGPAAGRAA